MATFVEVNSVDKNCPVIINLDQIIEIAPLIDGGCILYMADSAGVNARQGIRVRDDYKLFTQFAMQTVTAEDIERRFPKNTKKQPAPVTDIPLEIPKL